MGSASNRGSRVAWLQKRATVTYWQIIVFYSMAAVWAFAGLLRFTDWVSGF